jgi:hypothetical protein
MINISDLFKLSFYFLVILVIMILLGKNMFHHASPAMLDLGGCIQKHQRNYTFKPILGCRVGKY